MFGKTKPEVLVVGAGPVGQFTALALAKRGIAVQIVDEEWRPAAHSYALALHPHSMRLLEELGVLGDVLDSAYRVRSVALYDGAERKAEMRLSDLAEDFSFVAVMRQDALEGLLESALKKEGVKIQWNHRVARFDPHDGGVKVAVDKLVKESVGYAVSHTEWMVSGTKELDVPFVIGSDGHRSLIRRALEIEFDEAAPAQHFAVFEFRTDADTHNEMRLVLGPDHTNVLWPLPDNHCRWSFQIDDAEFSGATRVKERLAVSLGTSRFPMLEEEDLDRLVHERAPWFKGKVEKINWRMAVRFESRLARSFGTGRTWLAGDAGHMTGPVGGQSMNVGLREGYELASIMTRILREGASLDLLQDYNRGRLAEWRFLLGLDDGLSARADAREWIRARMDRLLPCVPASGADLVQLVQQLGIDVEDVSVQVSDSSED